MRRRVARGIVLAAVALAAGFGAEAQQIAFERVAPLRETVQANLRRARWRLGPIRIYPILRISDLGYTNNSLGTGEGEAKPDYTASVSAGLGFVVPFGRDVFLFGEEAPRYDWFAHLVERRHLGGRYGASLGAFLRRVTFVGNAGYRRDTTIFSSELLQPVDQEVRDAHVTLELSILERLALIGSADGEVDRNQSTLDDAAQRFRALDGDRLAGRAGILYKFRGRLNVSAQAEKTRQTFRLEGALRDNETTAYLLGLGYNRPKLYIDASAGYREGGSYNSSSFPNFRGVTGSGFVSWFPNRRLEITVGGTRKLVSSLFVENPYYVETMGHAGLSIKLGHRMTLLGFGELSTLDYPLAQDSAGNAIRRFDRGNTLGGGLGLQLFRATGLTVRASRTRYTSNVPGFNRTVFIVTSSLTLDAFVPQEVRE